MKIEFKFPNEAKILMDEITERYKVAHTRPDIHATDCIYCLRKAYWDKIDFLPPTPQEILYFIQGLGLQQVMLGDEELVSGEVHSNSLIKVLFSPDKIINENIIELKTTRMGKKRLVEGDLPEGWIKQLKFYCHALGRTSALLIALPLIKPEIVPLVVEFTQEELMENVRWILERAEKLQIALGKKRVPPKEEGWQCRNCRYQLRCRIENDK